MNGILEHLVETESFYDDMRAAETDHERGAVLMEYQVSHLDSGYEPDHVDEDWYHENIVPGVENELGLEVPDVDVLRYEDSGQFIYDTMTAEMEELPVLDLFGKDAEQLVPPEDADLKTRLLHDIKVQARLVPARVARTEMSEQVCGVAYNDGEQIAYSVPGTKRRADETGNAYEDIRNAVLEHETIHAVQSDQYTELFDARTEIIDDLRTYAEDPGAYLQDAMETDILEALDDPEAFIHDNLNLMAMPSMTLIEGHAEFYTDRIADVDLRADGEMADPSGLFDGIQHPKDILEVVRDTAELRERLQDFTPHGAKKAQYRNGKNFLEEVHRHGGNEYVHYTMQHPPDSIYDIRNPEHWVDHIEDQLS